ncbi:UDP-N-acetylmuramate--L-alanine ligase [Brochothrix campestris]|uniref:UDP-N-acetylmuramate--L-alanine ligase n=1 Tax=Brochothrix campestris FSL F6-1037 TaxID=1265861 RepID=W7C7Q7_9LIST|nr:UDP-N-acetylmuramate--L-alanine ligase [Brochothrix campestris]EUJ35469.1 UDP-N-acetylmuramate--L-alanine ligase [Brochothrix campestris FSL F6-1037]
MSTYHFIGIKGTGMSALAQILHDEGKTVQGSDIDKEFFTQRALERANIKLLPFAKENITADMVVIQGAAFPDTHEEVVAAKQLGATLYQYNDFLGKLIEGYASIAVTGSHGKTSTTGLLSHVLEGITSVSYLIGDGTGRGVKAANYFALEACEYQRHFLAYKPHFTIINNIDWDHPDYFKTEDDVVDAFQSLVYQTKEIVIANGDDEKVRSLKLTTPVVYFGLGEENNYRATNINRHTAGCTFDVMIDGKLYGSFNVPTFGEHNVRNALAVIAFTQLQGLPIEAVQARMRTYAGVKRRFSEKVIGDQILFDDYAHHPAEIEATINAARQKYPDRQVIAIFQPHTFSRTNAFLQNFAESLSKADATYLCDIFGSAREQTGDLTIQDLGDLIEGSHIIQEQHTEVLKAYKTGVLLFMGAGDIQKFQKAYELTLTAQQ